MATYKLRAFDSSGNPADRVTTTATGPGSLGTVNGLNFHLPVAGDYTFAAATPETASYEVVRAIQDDTAPTISGLASDGSTVTITEGTYTGTTPITITGTLYLDGLDVTADMNGSDYTIPAGSLGKVLEWKERASNFDGVSRQQTASLTGTGAFSPASLFASGEQGGWYDPSDLTTLFQDSAGTTAVTANGDSVGYMNDNSGNGIDLSQATSAARPVYYTDGTYHAIEFDGVDDTLQSVTTMDFSGTDVVTFCFGVESLDASGGNNTWITHADDFDNYRFLAQAPHSSTNHYRVFGKGTTNASASATAAQYAPPDGPRVITATVDVGADLITLRIDGVQVATASGMGTAGNFRNEPLFLGSFINDIAFGNTRIYPGAIIGRHLTTQERDTLEAFVADKCGATL